MGPQNVRHNNESFFRPNSEFVLAIAAGVSHRGRWLLPRASLLRPGTPEHYHDASTDATKSDGTNRKRNDHVVCYEASSAFMDGADARPQRTRSPWACALASIAGRDRAPAAARDEA